MTNIKRLALWVMLFWLLVPLALAQSYTITDLGLLPGSYETSAYGVNNFGRVVGWAGLQGTAEAFVWTGGQGIRQLETPSGYTYVNAYAINNFGDAVGTGAPVNEADHALLWTRNGDVLDLGIPPQLTSSIATDINDLGVVTGYAHYSGAFVWSRNEGFRVLPMLPGSDETVASSINLFNDVVGYVSFDDFLVAHAFLWTPEKGVQELEPLPGTTNTVAFGNNNVGQIVGYGGKFDTEWIRALLWEKDGRDVIDLGVLGGDGRSVAIAINDFGETVGISYGQSSNPDHAFLWTRYRGMEDLNNLIPANSGWVLNSANSINLEGMICGYGTVKNETHAFLLVPTRSAYSAID